MPIFVLDENFPPDFVGKLRSKGWRCFHINDTTFRKGTSDRVIKEYIEKSKEVLLTKDVGFVEPMTHGDRVLFPSHSTVEDINSRLIELGWKPGRGGKKVLNSSYINYIVK